MNTNECKRPCLMYFPPDSPHLYILHPPIWASLSDFSCVYLLALEALQWLAVAHGLPESVWVTLVKELPCQDLLMDTWDPVLHHSSVVPMYLPLPTPLHPTCRLSLYHHGPWRLCSGWLWRVVYHGGMGNIGQWTTLPRPSNGYMRPCSTPFVSGAYVLAPPHASTSHLPPEPLSSPLSDLSCVRTGPGGSAVAVARGLPWSVWVTLTLVKKIPCPLKLIDIDDKWIHETMFYTISQWWPC